MSPRLSGHFSIFGWVFIVLKSLLGIARQWNHCNRPFPSSPGPLFQNEVECSAFNMEMIFHSHVNKTHFHKKGCAPSLILKERVFGTWKWPILTLKRRIQVRMIKYRMEAIVVLLPKSIVF